MHFDGLLVYSHSKATHGNCFNMGVICVQLFIFLLTSHICSSDWVSDWMSPIQDHLEVARRRMDGESMMVQLSQDEENSEKTTPEPKMSIQLSAVNLMVKLDQTLRTAKVLAETLKVQIRNLVERETTLKEAITSGRLGVSTLTVSTMSQVPRSYIIRDGRWKLCNGMIQFPVSQISSTNLFNGLISEPRCIGREVVTDQDPCVFNSIIKYEVIPSVRTPEYAEDEYLCLKPTFNTTMERYMSITKRIINETCKDGVVRSLAENNQECGLRMLSEYTFYPHKSSAAATLPLEYCVEKDGSCKLTVAWHLSNTTIENFEFLKDEHNFKKYFISNVPYIEHVI